MNEDLSELVQYLSERFDNVDQKLEDLRDNFVSLRVGVDSYAKKSRHLLPGNGNAIA